MHKFIKRLSLFLYYLIACKLPQPPLPGGKFGNRLRRFFVKRIFLQCGRDVVIRKNAYFGSGAEIEIGDFSEIGLNAYINRDIKIGSHVLMGQNVTIFSVNHEFEDPDTPIHHQGHRERTPAIIEDDVWIGANVVILPGVRIGRGAVIGACSLVAHDVPPLAVVCGNPARVVRQRGSRFKPGQRPTHRIIAADE